MKAQPSMPQFSIAISAFGCMHLSYGMCWESQPETQCVCLEGSITESRASLADARNFSL